MMCKKLRAVMGKCLAFLAAQPAPSHSKTFLQKIDLNPLLFHCLKSCIYRRSMDYA